MRAISRNPEKLLLYSILFALAILLVPFLGRIFLHYPMLFGSDSYYSARISQQVIQGLPKYDPFIYGTRQLNADPYIYLVAGLSLLIGIELASIILPIGLGIGSIVLFHHILKRQGLKHRERLLAMLLLISSPAFIYTFTASAYPCLVVFLYLAAFILMGLRRWWSSILSLLIIALTLLFSTITSAVTVLVLLLMLLAYFERAELLKLLLGAILLFSLISLHSAFYPDSYADLAAQLLSDFGSINGFGIFTILFSLAAFLTLWPQRRRLAPLYFGFILFLTGSLAFGRLMNSYSMFFFSLFSAMQINNLLVKRWKVKLLKMLMLFVILCGVLFSTLSYLNRLSHLEPTPQMAESLLWLKEQPVGLVLSHPSNGFWIQHFSNMAVISDGLSELSPPRGMVHNDTNLIFKSRNLLKTEQLMKIYSIKYVWIDDKMLSGQVWSKPSEGLLFLFRSNETFRKAYSEDGIQIWEYMGGD